jgi:integrase
MAKRRSQGEGSIYQRADGRYVAEITVRDASGKRRRVKRSARTKTQAREKLSELIQLQKQGVELTSGDAPVSKFLERWLEDSVKPSVRTKTFDNYESIIRVRINPRIGGVKMSKLTPAVLQQLYTDLTESGLSARSVHNTHRVLHKAFSQALRWGLIPRNPCEAVDPPRPKQTEMQTLTSAQVSVLLNGTASQRNHALYLLAVTSGLRLGELLGLRWSDIDFDGKRLFVRRSLQRTRQGLEFVPPKTDKSRRTVMLTTSAITGLKEHRKRQNEQRLSLGPAWNDDDLVFPNTIGEPSDPSAASTHFQQVLKRIDLPKIRSHDLRHTAASLLLQAGTHPKIVQEMLGHSTITLTMDTYSHSIPSMHAEAADTMESIVSGVK